jgi:hypothetical protein
VYVFRIKYICVVSAYSMISFCLANKIAVKVAELTIGQLASDSFPSVRHYATNRKVAGSIPDEVIFKFTYSFRPH